MIVPTTGKRPVSTSKMIGKWWWHIWLKKKKKKQYEGKNIKQVKDF